MDFMQLSHFLTEPVETHETPKWKKLSNADASVIKRLQAGNPSRTERRWCCNHCSAHLEELVNYQGVIDHTQNKYGLLFCFASVIDFVRSPYRHGIKSPVEGIDFFHSNPSNRWRPRKQAFPVATVGGKASAWRCLQCTTKNRRFVDNLSVVQHIKAKCVHITYSFMYTILS